MRQRSLRNLLAHAARPFLEVLEDRLAPSNVPPAGITNWWTGDGSADDLLGGRNGTLVGGATTSPGLVDYAFNLNGNGAFVNVPDNPALNVGTGSFTIGLCVKFNSTVNEEVLAEKYIETFGSSATGWTLTKLSSNVLRLALTDGVDAPVDIDSKALTLPLNTWIYFAARRSGSTITTFMNGQAVASGTCAYNLNSTSSLKLGHRGNPTDTPGSTDTRQFYLNGSVDEAQFYVGTALTNTQILGISNDGAAGESKPMAVSRANPAADSYVTTPPTDFAVHFSETPASVSPSAFTVNGIAAASATQTGPDDVTFHFTTSPVTAQGLQTMAMAAGSLTAADTTLPASYQPLEAWSKTFRYEAVLMQVSSTSPAANGFVTLGNPTLQVTFNQPYDPSTVSTSNLTLSQGTVSGFALTSSTSVTYTLSGLTEGSLIATIAAGAVNDSYGNPMPIGYSAYYGVETGTAPFPTPLAAVNPAGSEVYQGSVAGQFVSQVPPFVYPGSGGLNRAIGATFGPDGNLYASSWNSNQVMRYNGTTGAPLPATGQSGAIFVSAGSGGLQSPEYLRFGPDGLLYVVSSPTNQVFRYNADGTFKDVFVKASSNGGLSHPLSLTFDAAGNLYVSGRDSNSVVRFDKSGNPTSFVASGSGGLTTPESLTFGPDGNLYVSSGNTNSILRYNGSTGAFLNAFVPAGSGGLSYPAGLAFGTDGKLYVSSVNTNSVLRYDGTTGTFLGDYAPSGAGGLTRPTDLTFGADGALYVSTENQSSVLRFDGSNGGPGALDNYTINLDANQTLALGATTAVAATLTLSYAGSPVAPGAGGLYPIAAAGSYTISIQAPNGLTTGSYTLHATLNAQFDSVSDGSVPVQFLAPSTLDVDPAQGINRAAVLGSVEKVVARVYKATAGVTNDLRGSWDESGTTTTWAVNGSGNPNSPLNTGVAGSLSKQVASEAFSFYGRAGDVVTLRTWGSSSGGGSLSPALLTLQDPSGVQTTGTQVPGASSDYTIANFALTLTGSYTVTVSTGRNGRGSYTLTASLVTPANPRPHAADVYGISATAGQFLSFGVATGDTLVGQPQAQLALYAPGVDPITGTPVATSTPRGTLDGFLEYDPTTTGSYEVKVTTGPGLTGSTVNYGLVAITNGSFQANGGDNSFATAQDISGRPGAVGAERQLTTTFVAAGSGGLNQPVGAVYGPDGNLYVASYGNNSILRYNPTTGAFLSTFVSSGSGGLNHPTGLFFGSDGKLYVVSQGNNSVLRYNGTTGAFLDTFVASGSGGLSEAQRAAFGPDGNLYVSSGNTNSILRYNGSTGAFLGAFVSAGSGGLVRPHAFFFAPDGDLYVASNRTNQVLRYNGTTGAFVDAFVAAGSGGLSAPTDMTFGPDGNLYISSWNNGRVLRYNGTTGAFMDAYLPPNDGGLTEPNALLFDASGSLYAASFDGNDILRSSVSPDYYQTTLTAGQTVTFNTLTPGDGPGQPANLLDPHVQLYDSNQVLVATGTKLADGRNETIAYTVPASATYYVEVSRQTFIEGDYVLDPVESGGDGGSTSPPTPGVAEVMSSHSGSPAAAPGLSEAGVDLLFAHLLGTVSPPAIAVAPPLAENSPANGRVFPATAYGVIDLDSNPPAAVPAAWIRTAAADTLFAQAEDSYGVFGDPVGLRLTVQ
jgi:glucose/arabinose dehydrogenase